MCGASLSSCAHDHTTSKHTSKHTHNRKTIYTLMWGSLRLAPISCLTLPMRRQHSKNYRQEEVHIYIAIQHHYGNCLYEQWSSGWFIKIMALLLLQQNLTVRHTLSIRFTFPLKLVILTSLEIANALGCFFSLSASSRGYDRQKCTCDREGDQVHEHVCVGGGRDLRLPDSIIDYID